MKLSDYMKKEIESLDDDLILDGADSKIKAKNGERIVIVGKKNTFKNIISVAACTIFAVAVAGALLILPGVLPAQDTTPGNIVDEQTDAETEFIPETLQSGTQLSFDGEYQYLLFGDDVSIYSYNGDATEITIPQEIAGYPVSDLAARKGIPENGIGTLPISVLDGTNVTSVTMSGNIRGVTLYAFYRSDNLENLVFENLTQSVTIEYGAFSECENLTNVTLAEGISSILNKAFYGCTSLKEIVIPASVEEIGSYAFANCTSLEKVTFLSEDTVVDITAFEGTIWGEKNSVDGLWEKELQIDPSKLADDIILSEDGLYNYYIDDGKAIIVRYVGYGEKIVIPEKVDGYTVQKIEGYTKIDNLISRIDFDDLFADIDSNNKFGILLGSNVIEIRVPGTIDVGHYAFAKCENVRTVILEEGIEHLYPFTFTGNSAPSLLTNLYFPRSLKKIDYAAIFSNNGMTIYYSGTEHEWNEIEKDIDYIIPSDSLRIVFER